MDAIQWIIAAGTAFFVALVGFFQWRTAQQKAVLDLFDRRHSIYLVVREAVKTMTSSSSAFDQEREIEFMANMERAYFFFGDDVQRYLVQMWNDIQDVRTADSELPAIQDAEERKGIVKRRRAALDRILEFQKAGKPLFARYMRFSQTVNPSFLK